MYGMATSSFPKEKAQSILGLFKWLGERDLNPHGDTFSSKHSCSGFRTPRPPYTRKTFFSPYGAAAHTPVPIWQPPVAVPFRVNSRCALTLNALRADRVVGSTLAVYARRFPSNPHFLLYCVGKTLTALLAVLIAPSSSGGKLSVT